MSLLLHERNFLLPERTAAVPASARIAALSTALLWGNTPSVQRITTLPLLAALCPGSQPKIPSVSSLPLQTAAEMVRNPAPFTSAVYPPSAFPPIYKQATGNK